MRYGIVELTFDKVLDTCRIAALWLPSNGSLELAPVHLYCRIGDSLAMADADGESIGTVGTGVEAEAALLTYFARVHSAETIALRDIVVTDTQRRVKYLVRVV